jgi:cubilin
MNFSFSFHTDPAAVDSGFRLEWYNEGCGGRLTHPYGEITSPNFPSKYEHELECRWEITVDYGKSIEFVIHELEMEQSDNCVFDSLVFAHDKNFTDIITKLCRPIHEPLILTTQGHKVYVKFESDESSHAKGFNATYRAAPAGEFFKMLSNLKLISI